MYLADPFIRRVCTLGSRYKVLYKLDLGKFNKLHPMPVVLPGTFARCIFVEISP